MPVVHPDSQENRQAYQEVSLTLWGAHVWAAVQKWDVQAGAAGTGCEGEI